MELKKTRTHQLLLTEVLTKKSKSFSFISNESLGKIFLKIKKGVEKL